MNTHAQETESLSWLESILEEHYRGAGLSKEQRDENIERDINKLLSRESSAVREAVEEVRGVVEKRIKYIDEFRSGKNEQDFRSGWSVVESGECCDKCRMEDKHFTGRADALKALVGCRNPFQLKDVCECHIPFRKVVAKAERKALSDVLNALK